MDNLFQLDSVESFTNVSTICINYYYPNIDNIAVRFQCTTTM